MDSKEYEVSVTPEELLKYQQAVAEMLDNMFIWQGVENVIIKNLNGYIYIKSGAYTNEKI